MSNEVCKCPIRPNMTYDELMNDIFIGPLDPKTGHHVSQNCCSSQQHPSKGWICSVLEKEMRRAETDRDRRKWYSKRLQNKHGLTSSELKSYNPRAKHSLKAEAFDIEL